MAICSPISNCCFAIAAMPVLRGEVDDGAHLGAEDAELRRPREQRVEIRHRFHELTPSFSASSPLSTLRKGTTPAILPQEGRNRLSFASPSIVRSNRIAPMTLSPVKAGDGHDAHAHLVHQPEHRVVAAVGAVGNAVETQGAGGRSAALVERGDEAVLARHLRHHLVISHDRHPRLRF